MTHARGVGAQYLSELLRTPVEGYGRIRDVFVSGSPPLVVTVEVDGGTRLSWTCLRTAGGGYAVDAPEDGPDGLSLAGGLLDRQILDARGRKVVRVNDAVLLAHEDGTVEVTGVDVGARGFLRRLGGERFAVRLAEVLGYQVTDAVIPWSYVTSLEPGQGVRLGIDRTLLRGMRPVEVAELLEALDRPDRERLLEVLDDRVLAGCIGDAPSRLQADVLQALGPARAGAVVALMPPDEAADVLGEMDVRRCDELLTCVSEPAATVIAGLLGYHPRSAGGLMTPEFIAVAASMTIAEAITALRLAAPETEAVWYVYAIGGRGELTGVVPLPRLLTAPESQFVSEIVRPDVISVTVDTGDEEIADLMQRYDLLALPVLDDRRVLKGIITVDDVMDAVASRVAEDLSAVAGSGTPGRESLAFAPGRVGGLVASMATGLLVAIVLARWGGTGAGWLSAAALPVLLRFSQDQAGWALAAHFEPDGLGARALAGAVLATLLPALALGGGAWLASGRALGVRITIATLAASILAVVIGAIGPRVIESMGRGSLARRGRLAPLGAALAAAALYTVVLAVLP